MVWGRSQMTSSKDLYFTPSPASSRLNPSPSEQKMTSSSPDPLELSFFFRFMFNIYINVITEGVKMADFFDYVRYERSLISLSSLIARLWKIYNFEILIHFYPNLVVKLAKISPKMVLKNYVIFGKNQPSQFENPHKPMTSFVNDPI